MTPLRRLMSRHKRLIGRASIAALVVVTGVAIWQTEGLHLQARTSRPALVMGTETELTVVTRGTEGRKARSALEEGEQALRDVEVRMSWRLPGSDVARLNAADANVFVKLTPETLKVLEVGRQVWQQSRGAFDVTGLPLYRLWQEEGQAGRVPIEAQRTHARAASTWGDLRLRRGGAAKRQASAGVDLGGIAKGFGIDQAVEAMRSAGVEGGLVNVGGDIRCFGKPASGQRWIIGVRSPFREEVFCTLQLEDGAVCTSGAYYRGYEVGDKRYSHIVDPREGQSPPYMALVAGETPSSVTVKAETAVVADAWATALSVLGPGGFVLLPQGVEAMIITGPERAFGVHATPGFVRLVAGELPTSPAAGP